MTENLKEGKVSEQTDGGRNGEEEKRKQAESGSMVSERHTKARTEMEGDANGI